jgi:hypothetical protein
MWKKGQQGSGAALGAWKPGQCGYVPGKGRRGTKPGVKRGPYKNRTAVTELREKLREENKASYPMRNKPALKAVGVEKNLSTREYLEAVYNSDSLPHDLRTSAALGLLYIRIMRPGPKAVISAFSGIGKPPRQ